MKGTARELHKWLVLAVMVVQLYFFHLSQAEHGVVKSLPGFRGPLPFELQTGYIGVGEEEEVQLFYYFAKSERNAKEDPLVLWLTGGPGCSSLSALLYENGPLTFERVKYDGTLPTLVLNPYSWNKVANMIFVDSPVGTGFSYARNPNASHSSDSKQAYHLYQFLSKWLTEQPEFLSNPVYIGGDSYSGFIVPPIVRHISDGNEDNVKPQINLKGYVLGNAATDDTFEANSRVPYAHGMGLISDELYESLQRSCGGDYVNVESSNSFCLRNMMTFNELTTGLFNWSILDTLCPIVRSSSFWRSQILEIEPEIPSFECRTYPYLFFYPWTGNRSVRRALHVRKCTVRHWKLCADQDLPYTNDIKSTINYHRYLSTKGYRSLIYSGDLDMIKPFLGTQAWIRSLNYSIVDDWRQWRVAGEVAGYTRTYSNGMTFATVKGGGHVVPLYKPEESLIMFKRWISEEPL